MANSWIGIAQGDCHRNNRGLIRKHLCKTMNRRGQFEVCSESLLVESSPLMRRFSFKIAVAAAGKPILDVACGSGRNALPLCQLGCTVICMDKDLAPLQSQQRLWCRSRFKGAVGRLVPRQLDLLAGSWPFGPSTVGGIINVHFLVPTLLPFFESSLSSGGYLLLETVPGCGGNYRQLPRAGELQAALANAFDFEYYKERRVGPRDCDAVTVRLLAKRWE
jgi:hypothetical protein